MFFFIEIYKSFKGNLINFILYINYFFNKKLIYVHECEFFNISDDGDCYFDNDMYFDEYFWDNEGM